MCRIVYILNHRHVKKLLLDFLQQSDHISKYTPGLNSESDAVTHPDGFGLACFHSFTHRWKVIKTPKQYRTVTNLPKLINDVSVSSLIIGHIRKQSGEMGHPSMENTHPFTYHNQLFVHNGSLPDFDCLSVSDKKKWISKSLYPHIKGQTDSEWMFYALLTVMETYEHPTEVSFDDILFYCIETWLNIFKQLFPYFNANVIYANKSHTIITRYRYERPGIPHQTAPSLYFHTDEKDERKVLISSEPLTETFALVPENVMILIHHQSRVDGYQSPMILRELS